MSNLLDHSLIKRLHRESQITLADLLDRKLFIEPPAEPCGHIEPGAWFLHYQEDLPQTEQERLSEAVKLNPRLIRAAALVVASVTGELSKQQKYMAFDFARYVEAHEYELAQLERQAPLRNKAEQQKSVKSEIQKEAREIWGNDQENECKTGYVAAVLHSKAQDLSPSGDIGIDTVKNWVREVAPEYAKKGGRPKKTL